MTDHMSAAEARVQQAAPVGLGEPVRPELEARRRRFYRGARVGVTPKTPRSAVRIPPFTAPQAAVGTAVADIPVSVMPPQSDGRLHGSRAWHEWDEL